MEIPVYTVDAFTRAPFKGNPAVVCVVSRQMVRINNIFEDMTMLMIMVLSVSW